MIKKLIYSIFFSIFSIVTFAQELSFTEAIVLFQSSNQKLLGKQKQVEAAKLGVKSSKGLRFPTLELNGSYVLMNDDLYLDFNRYRNAASNFLDVQPSLLGDWRVKFQEYNIGRLSADFKWPIYTGGKINAGIKVSELQAELAVNEAFQIESDLMTQLAKRYFQVQLAQKAILVRKEALQAAEQHLYNAQKLQENGMLAPVETMQAQTAVSDAERELMASQKDKELARAALFGIIGIEETAFTLSTELFDIKDLQPLSYYQDLAVKNYPKIAEARIKKKLAEQKVAAEKSNFIPDVALIGKKYLYHENLPLTEPEWYVGVGLNVNIFNGLQNRTNYKQAKLQSESVDLLIAQAERDITTLVKKYYTEIEKQQEQLNSLEKSIAFSEELVRVRKKAFAAGFATSTDVADANLYLASIRIKRLQAMYEMDTALAELLETSGVSMNFINYTL